MDVPAHIRQAVEQTTAIGAAVAPDLCRVGAYGILKNVVTPHEAVMEGEKRRGRPAKPAAERRSTNLKFRTRPVLRERIEAAAAANNRTASQEIEHRLERSFANDEMRSIIREELAASGPEITGSPVNIDARGIDHELLTAALRQFHRETKIHG